MKFYNILETDSITTILSKASIDGMNCLTSIITNNAKNLYTNNIPDPDILIRTGGTKRLSNFLLWQIAYTEIFFVDKLWPDFKEKDFNEIVERFYKIKRNFGKI